MNCTFDFPNMGTVHLNQVLLVSSRKISLSVWLPESNGSWWGRELDTLCDHFCCEKGPSLLMWYAEFSLDFLGDE